VSKKYNRKYMTPRGCLECSKTFYALRPDANCCSQRCRKSLSRRLPLGDSPLQRDALQALWQIISRETTELVDMMAFHDLCHDVTAPAWVMQTAEVLLAQFMGGGAACVRSWLFYRIDIDNRMLAWMK
jgi:hypothetical protein